MDFKVIKIDPASHEQLKKDASEFGAKVQRMVTAWGRGWNLLTPEQKMEAIRDRQPLPSPLAQLPEDPDSLDAAIDLERVCGAVLKMVHDARRDGVVDRKESDRIMSILRALPKQVEKIAVAVQAESVPA